jgi:hypothetical protein
MGKLGATVRILCQIDLLKADSSAREELLRGHTPRAGISRIERDGLHYFKKNSC